MKVPGKLNYLQQPTDDLLWKKWHMGEASVMDFLYTLKKQQFFSLFCNSFYFYTKISIFLSFWGFFHFIASGLDTKT